MISFSERSLAKLLIALTIYLTSLFAANTLGLKIMPFLFGTHLTVSIFSLPFVFVGTDIIGEVYGKRVAQYFVWAGFISILLFMVYSILSLAMPWSPEGLWAKDGYEMMFGVSLRIGLASLVAFLVGEYQDVILFFFLRKRLGTSKFWLRSLISNIWSQFLDSALFMLIAFAGVYEWPVLISITLTLWGFKVLMGFLYTPLSYAGIFLLREPDASKAN